MTSVILEKTPATPAAVAVIIAGLSPVLYPPDFSPLDAPETKYCFDTISRTFGALSEAVVGEETDHPFSQQISSFYARMLNEQEALGADFEKVLDDNAWDLYVRD